MPLRLALVGLGRIHPVHAKALAQVPELEVVAAFDPRPDARCEVPGVARADSLQSLVAREDVDAAVVAAPTLDHEAVTKEVLEAGVDVLLEKPVAVTLAGFDGLYATAAASGRLCYSMLHDSVGDEVVHYQVRILPGIRGALGRLEAVRATYHDPYAARGELESRRPGLVGSWLDSASNALSVVACFAQRLELRGAEILVDAPGAPDVEDVAARATFSGVEVGGRDELPVEVIVETSWLEDHQWKGTRLQYEHGVVTLQHEARRITIERPGDESEVIDTVTEMDRLVSQYVRVFEEFTRMAAAGADNREFAAEVHRPLLSVYGPDLVRRYRQA